MPSPFSPTAVTFEGPAIGAFVVTPHNTDPLASPIRFVTINVGGTISYQGWDSVTYTTDFLPAGTYTLLALKVFATGTSALNITGWV